MNRVRLTLRRYRHWLPLVSLMVVAIAWVTHRAYSLYDQNAVAADLRTSNQSTYVATDHDVRNDPQWTDKLRELDSTISSAVQDNVGSSIASPVVRLFITVDQDKPITADLIPRLPDLRWLHINAGGTINTKDPTRPVSPPLDRLKNSTKLQYLILGNWANLSPTGSPGFRGTGVTLLPLNITPDSLAHLQSLPELRILALGGNNIDDHGLSCLARLSHLEHLYLSRTNITEAGYAKLKVMLPQTEIVTMTDANADYSAEINALF